MAHLREASMTPEERQAIRERAEAATPGPWHAGPSYYEGPLVSYVAGAHVSVHPEASDDRQEGVADAEFIAHARSDVPALLDDIDRLEAEKAELEAEQDALVERLRTTGDRCSCTVPPYCDDCAADLALVTRLAKS